MPDAVVKCRKHVAMIYSVLVQALGSRFPYRPGFALEDVKFVWLLGGSDGMVWTDLALPHTHIDIGQDELNYVFRHF